MTLEEYQAVARTTVNPNLDDRGRLLDAAAGLAEEAGEVLSHVRKHLFQGRALDRAGVREELGDALWCLAAVASALDLPLGEVANHNLRKIGRKAGTSMSAESSELG
jgi:NTP pyrophosphatase (non-canonical NTP hydrolase)